DLPIPGNDDSIRSIELILSYLADAVAEGAKTREENKFDGAQETVEDDAAEEKAASDAE
ncbi:MAG: 30S ribosomal protein S2, partial [Thermoguttaceae bacterium]|nr:30S ribosomal protein S2 [Thermoguttaceae bacterium]